MYVRCAVKEAIARRDIMSNIDTGVGKGGQGGTPLFSKGGYFLDRIIVN